MGLLGLQQAHCDKIVVMLLSRLRGNVPLAFRPMLKGIFGKGQVKCSSAVGV